MNFIMHSTITVYQKLKHLKMSLKGLGHAILDNFCTDQMVIELTKK